MSDKGKGVERKAHQQPNTPTVSVMEEAFVDDQLLNEPDSVEKVHQDFAQENPMKKASRISKAVMKHSENFVDRNELAQLLEEHSANIFTKLEDTMNVFTEKIKIQATPQNVSRHNSRFQDSDDTEFEEENRTFTEKIDRFGSAHRNARAESPPDAIFDSNRRQTLFEKQYATTIAHDSQHSTVNHMGNKVLYLQSPIDYKPQLYLSKLKVYHIINFIEKYRTLQVLTAVSNGDKTEIPKGCFSLAFGTPCSRERACPYSHDKTVLAATWKYYFKLLQSSPFNERGMVARPTSAQQSSFSTPTNKTTFPRSVLKNPNSVPHSSQRRVAHISKIEDDDSA
jgi:hypothetical protein